MQIVFICEDLKKKFCEHQPQPHLLCENNEFSINQSINDNDVKCSNNTLSFPVSLIIYWSSCSVMYNKMHLMTSHVTRIQTSLVSPGSDVESCNPRCLLSKGHHHAPITLLYYATFYNLQFLNILKPHFKTSKYLKCHWHIYMESLFNFNRSSCTAL